MSGARRTAVTVAAVALALVAALAVVLGAVWADLAPAERDVLRPIVSREAGLAAALGLLALVLLAFATAWRADRRASAARALAEDLRVVASANPEHEVRAPAAGELAEVAAEARALAGRYAAAVGERERATQAARAESEQERNRLAALMAHMTQAVLLCTLDGRILLYNGHARALLGEGGYVGLGRSVLDLAPDGSLAGARDTLVALAAAGDEVPEARCALSAGGRVLRVQLSGVRDAGGELGGFLALAEDVTAAAATSGRRDALLRELAEGTRASVAGMRAAAEALRDYDDAGPEERRRLLAVVADEGEALTARLDSALAALGGAAAAGEWTLDRLTARDAIAALARALRREGGVAVSCAAACDSWVALDTQRLAAALAALPLPAGSGDAAGRGLELAAEGAGGVVRVDLRWPGAPLGAAELAAWEQREAAPGVPVRDVLAHHGAEAWCGAAGERSALHVLLPAAAPAARPTAASLRPVTYDFDLFGALDRAGALGERPLRRLELTVFDCETTGLSADAGDEIVAIGAVRVVNGRVLGAETFDELVDPRRRVSPAAQAVHGLSDADLAGRPGIEQVLPRFARFAAGTVLAGHDVAFDLRFLERHREHAGELLDQPVLDTLLLGAAALGEHGELTLDGLAARLGVDVRGRHSALGDALTTAAVLAALIPALEARGARTLAEAAAAARATQQARVSESLYARGGAS